LKVYKKLKKKIKLGNLEIAPCFMAETKAIKEA
jgi:hypothetical protein